MDKKHKKKYTKEILQKLKTNVKLEEIIEKDFSLEKFGKNYFAACPFCGAKKALSISPQKQFAYCFSCNESFDVFGYYQKTKGLSFGQSVVEVKKQINLNNDIEFQKLLKASLYFIDLKEGKNPISNDTIRSTILRTEATIEMLNKIDRMLVFLISDYSNLNQEKCLLPEEIVDCEQKIQKILKIGFNEESPDSQMSLSNLFKYILDLLLLIKGNNCNLGGIVYGLK